MNHVHVGSLIANSTLVTEAKLKSEFVFPTGNQYLSQRASYEVSIVRNLEKNWSRYNGSMLYMIHFPSISVAK